MNRKSILFKVLVPNVQCDKSGISSELSSKSTVQRRISSGLYREYRRGKDLTCDRAEKSTVAQVYAVRCVVVPEAHN